MDNNLYNKNSNSLIRKNSLSNPGYMENKKDRSGVIRFINDIAS